MTLLGLALAFVVGIALGFFGGGGSILMVPLLVYGFGLPAREAIAGSLGIIALASVGAAVQHARAGRVCLRPALAFGAAGVVGAQMGGRANAYVDAGVLLLLFAATMLATGLAMARGRTPSAETHATGATARPTRAHAISTPRLAAQGLVVGAFTGLVGAGGGFLIVPALVLGAGLPVELAVGTSLVVIVAQSASAFLATLSHVSVPADLVGTIAASTLAGSLAGARLTAAVAPARLRRSFAAFVVVMGAIVAVREGDAFASTLDAALPTNGPQLLLVIAMTALGGFAGRTRLRADSPRGWRAPPELRWTEGAGI